MESHVIDVVLSAVVFDCIEDDSCLSAVLMDIPLLASVSC